MGLLDDAIREHVELKRLRGADPGEVARIEHDALGPVVRTHGDPEEVGTFDDDEGAPAGAEHSRRVLEQDDPSTRGPDFAHVGQETAELDMRTVLDAQSQHDPLEASPETHVVMPGQERLWFDQEQGSLRDFDFDP